MTFTFYLLNAMYQTYYCFYEPTFLWILDRKKNPQAKVDAVIIQILSQYNIHILFLYTVC